MPDSSKVLQRLTKEYKSAGKPISVSFRDLVPWIPYNSPRYSHQIHSYPAKVIPHIPHFFLGCKSIIGHDSQILDPFGGSGTVALEACLAGVNAIVSDSNPLARLITKVSTATRRSSGSDQNAELHRDMVAARWVVASAVCRIRASSRARSAAAWGSCGMSCMAFQGQGRTSKLANVIADPAVIVLGVEGWAKYPMVTCADAAQYRRVEKLMMLPLAHAPWTGRRTATPPTMTLISSMPVDPAEI